MPNAPRELFSRETEHDGWAPAKFSDVMVEFAEPLLSVEPDGPENIQTLKNVMSLATLCWNAPMREVQGDRSLMEILQPVLMAAPEPIAAALRQMLASRLTRYGAVPHTILAEVTGSSLDDARCVARAYAANGAGTHGLASDADAGHGRLAAGALQPLEAATILPLAQLFPQLAEQEQEVWRVGEHEPDSRR